jgi:hypothetical protein
LLECAYYVAGQNLGVRNQITYTGNLTAVGFRVELPKSWTYVAVYGASVPDVKPQEGARDTLEFAWISPPASPLSLTYEVLAPEGESGIKEIGATVVYRRLGGEQTEAVKPNPLVVDQK